MGVFCDRLKLCSTAALDCQTGQNKGRYLVKISLPDDIIAKAVAQVLYTVSLLSPFPAKKL